VRYNPTQTIVGYRHYDSGSPDLVRNVKFVNFQPVRFFFNGRIRNAAAISVQSGNHVIAPRNKYFRCTFINAPVRVFYEEGTSVAHIGAAIVDADGSITGSCGAEIVPRRPMMVDASCVHFPAWQAYVCPPNGHPHRYINVEDLSSGSYGTVITEANEALRKDRAAVTYVRLFDKAEHRIEAFSKDYTTGPNDITRSVDLIRPSFTHRWPADTTPSMP